jgi:hypothetical protein
VGVAHSFSRQFINARRNSVRITITPKVGIDILRTYPNNIRAIIRLNYG